MSWVDSVFQFLAKARHNTVLPSYASGDQAELQTDANGRLLVNLANGSFDGSRLRVQQDPTGILWFATQAAPLATTVVKASAGRVHRVALTNDGAGAAIVWVLDGSTVLSPPVQINPGFSAVIDFPGGRTFTTALTVLVSDAFTAPPTASATEKVWVGAKYE